MYNEPENEGYVWSLSSGHTMRIGTDCSGIDAPVQAVKNIGVPFRHVFSCDLDKWCMQVIQQNSPPERMLQMDMRERDVDSVPDVDLYVCGFPCQPFSIRGKREGMQDKRGNVFFACAEYIRRKRPTFFLLENVPLLVTLEGGETFRVIMEELNAIGGYVVEWAKMDTKDYGIPQRRRRIYILGRRDGGGKVLPPNLIPCSPQDAFVDWSNREPPPPCGNQTERARVLTTHILRGGGCFLDTQQYRVPQRVPRDTTFSSCLITSTTLWCAKLERWASVKELLRLQGFPDDFIPLKSDSKMKKLVGNTMSVNVLESILSPLLLGVDCAGSFLPYNVSRVLRQ